MGSMVVRYSEHSERENEPNESAIHTQYLINTRLFSLAQEDHLFLDFWFQIMQRFIMRMFVAFLFTLQFSESELSSL